MEPISAILGIVDACLQAKDDVVQNRKKSERLMDAVAAVKPSLCMLENRLKENQAPIAHEEPLSKLKTTVEAALALLQGQKKRNYLWHVMHRAGIRQEFEGIHRALQMHIASVNLSMGVHGGVLAEERDANARVNAAEIQASLKDQAGRAGLNISDFFMPASRVSFPLCLED